MALLTAILAVFSDVGLWIIEMLTSMEGLFWTVTEGSVQLTYVGILSICGLAFSVVFLILGVLQRFLRFK